MYIKLTHNIVNMDKKKIEEQQNSLLNSYRFYEHKKIKAALEKQKPMTHEEFLKKKP